MNDNDALFERMEELYDAIGKELMSIEDYVESNLDHIKRDKEAKAEAK